jgi:hypothetical protein
MVHHTSIREIHSINQLAVGDNRLVSRLVSGDNWSGGQLDNWLDIRLEIRDCRLMDQPTEKSTTCWMTEWSV